MKENDVQKVYWAAYEDGEVMESDDGILLISFDKETVEHYPSLPNQVLQVMICRPTASRPVDAALNSPPEIEHEHNEGCALNSRHCPDHNGEQVEIEGLDEAIDGVAEYQQLRQRCGFTKKITQHISVVLEAARRYAALPHCPDGFALIKLGRFKPTPFSPVTYVTKTHPDTIRVDCVGEKNSYSFALPIAAAEGKDG